jgi:fatty acid desaturase
MATLSGLLALHWFVVGSGLPILLGITIPLTGFVMACMLSIVHEASHEVYVSDPAVNRLIGFLSALYIGMNFRLYRREHGLHHAHFATALDPEGTTLVRSRGELLRVLLWNTHAIAHWRRSFSAIMNANESAASRAIARDGVALALFFAAMAVATVFAPKIVLLGYWLPLLASLVADNAISLPEHTHFGAEVDDPTPIVRTLRPSPVVAFLLYYVNLHREHHADGTISAAVTEPSGPTCGIGYLAFHWAEMTRLGADRGAPRLA